MSLASLLISFFPVYGQSVSSGVMQKVELDLIIIRASLKSLTHVLADLGQSMLLPRLSFPLDDGCRAALPHHCGRRLTGDGARYT